jgi:dTDP-4-amino-4,6-dideoxygalactose transaminase
MDLDILENTLKKEKNIKAVLMVHLYGQMSDMDRVLKLKNKYGFQLIEDCAQAHGAQYKNSRSGSFGDAAAFSFYATKNLMTGEGGMVLTNSTKTSKALRQIVNHGRAEHSTFAILGYNYRLTNLAAAIGIAQLSQLEEWIEKRNENASKFYEAFKDLGFIKPPIVSKEYRHAFHQYTIRIKSDLRKDFMDYLKSNGISSGIYYDTVMYKQPVYKKLGYKSGICPQAELAAKEVLSIPVHPSLSDSDIDQIIRAVKGFKK